MVLGSRYLDGITVVNWPIERLLISYFGNWYARRVTGLRMRDTTGGFKCLRRELLEQIDFERMRANGYAFQIEMNYRFQKRGCAHEGDPLLLPGSAARHLEDHDAHRSRGTLDRLVAAPRRSHRPPLAVLGPCRVLVLNERDLRQPKTGGAETHLFEIMSRLVTRGYEMSQLAAGFEGGASEGWVDGVRVRRLGDAGSLLPRSVAFTCARETRRGRFDVVVECLNKVPFLSPLYSAVPVLALCHHLFGETAFQQVAWPIAAAVYGLERLIPPLYRRAALRRHLGQLAGRPGAARHARGPHLREPLRDRRPALTVPRPLRERPCSSSFVGRLERYKRVDVLLRAVARADRRLSGAETGPDRSRAATARASRRWPAQLGLEKRIRFAGFVTDDERDAILGAVARLRVRLREGGLGPHRDRGERRRDARGGERRTRACATRCVRGETGFLVPTGDVESFADRIAALLRADAAAERMASAALGWSQRFDWNLAADEMAVAIAAARGGS